MNRNGTRSPESKAVAFALPDGFSLGGVTTWSLQMRKMLLARGRPGYILRHRFLRESDECVAAETGGSTIHCPSRQRVADTEINVANYRSVLPAVIVPNWSPEAYAFCARLGRKESSRLRVIGYCHTDEEYYYTTLCRYESIIHRFVAVSQACAEQLRARLPQRAKDIVQRAYSVEAPAALRRTAPAPDAPIRLLYAGRIEQKQKRVFDLVELADRLTQRGVHFTLRIVGAGVDRAELASRLERMSPETRQRVRLEPAVLPSAMEGLYHEADLCVLTSAYEGTSIFMLEAMARGCVPVVTRVSGVAEVIDPRESNVGGCDESGLLRHALLAPCGDISCLKVYIGDGAAGLAFPVGAIDAMASGIEHLANNRDQLQTMSARAHERSRLWSHERYLDWFLALVDSTWSEPSRQWSRWRPYGAPRPKNWQDWALSIPGAQPLWRRLQRSDA